MTWTQLQQDGIVKPHTATQSEVTDLRGVIARNLADAAVTALSADNRLGLAYEAVLVCSKMVTAACGYRVRSGANAHGSTLNCARLALGPAVDKVIDYFDAVRRKRNMLSYDVAGRISEAEASEALREASGFCQTVDEWIRTNHPSLA